MQTIRTTITLDKDLYEDLKLEAVKKRLSLNRVMVDKIRSKKSNKNKKVMLEMRRLAKGINTKGIDYKALINEGRKY